MYGQIIGMIKSVKNEYLSALLNKLFVEDKEFLKSFQEHSAAKTVQSWFYRRTDGAHLKRYKAL